MGQSNFRALNKWKKVWVAGFLEKKHQSIIWGQNHLIKLQDEPLHRETAVAVFLETFETWRTEENFNTAETIQRLWGEIFLMKCASKVQEARMKGRRSEKQLARDVGERAGNTARGNLPE
jgi:hypothetical protein